MSGNVWEWTQDWYADYPTGGFTDPIGAESGSLRVFRGGDWYGQAENATVSRRDYDSPDRTGPYVGFRLARSSL